MMQEGEKMLGDAQKMQTQMMDNMRKCVTPTER